MKKKSTDVTQIEKIAPLKDGLPRQAFAIVPDEKDPAGWQLPHHTREVKRAAAGKVAMSRRSTGCCWKRPSCFYRASAMKAAVSPPTPS